MISLVRISIGTSAEHVSGIDASSIVTAGVIELLSVSKYARVKLFSVRIVCAGGSVAVRSLGDCTSGTPLFLSTDWQNSDLGEKHTAPRMTSDIKTRRYFIFSVLNGSQKG